MEMFQNVLPRLHGLPASFSWGIGHFGNDPLQIMLVIRDHRLAAAGVHHNLLRWPTDAHDDRPLHCHDLKDLRRNHGSKQLGPV